ncbi:MAG TPA: twin-arginine translocase TatA/TatE family subunit [Candidatus Saccharimonadales bacterium]|jgi:sec-independent protein translocase protein TatA
MVTQFAILDLGTPQLLILLAIVLLLFGSKKLPELSRSLGESVHELRKGLNEDHAKKDVKDEKRTEASS